MSKEKLAAEGLVTAPVFEEELGRYPDWDHSTQPKGKGATGRNIRIWLSFGFLMLS